MASKTLYLTQGADFSTDMMLLNNDGTPINVNTWIFTGSVRRNPYSTVGANLTITVIDTANGNTMISMNAATVSNLVQGSYMYTVAGANAGNTTVLLSGIAIVNPSTLVIQPGPYVYTNANSSEFIANANNQTANIP